MKQIFETMISEHDHQSNLFSWAAMAKVKYPELTLLYAVPNAAKRSKTLSAIMKAEGLKSGVPDVCLPISRKGFGSLYIEMKSKAGKITENQTIWRDNLIKFGNKSVVCWSFDEARAVIEDYLNG